LADEHANNTTLTEPFLQSADKQNMHPSFSD